MKKTILACAIVSALTANTALAGNMSDPILEQDLIATEAAASSMSGTAFVALLALTLLIPALD